MAHSRSMVVKDACQHRVQVVNTGARQVGETRGQVCFQGSAVDGADISRHDVRRPEGGTAMLRWQMTQALPEAME